MLVIFDKCEFEQITRAAHQEEIHQIKKTALVLATILT